MKSLLLAGASVGLVATTIPSAFAQSVNDSITTPTTTVNYSEALTSHVAHNAQEMQFLLSQFQNQKKSGLSESESIKQTKQAMDDANKIWFKTHDKKQLYAYMANHGFIVFDPSTTQVPSTPSPPQNNTTNVGITSPKPNAYYYQSNSSQINMDNPEWAYDYYTGHWTISSSWNWVDNSGWFDDMENGSLDGPDSAGIWFAWMPYSYIVGAQMTVQGANGVSQTYHYPDAGAQAQDGSTALAMIFSGPDETTYYTGAGTYDDESYSWEYGNIYLVVKSGFTPQLGSGKSICLTEFYHTAENQETTSLSVTKDGVGWSWDTVGYGWKVTSVGGTHY